VPRVAPWDLPSPAERSAGASLAARLDLPIVAGELLVRRGFADPDIASAWLSGSRGSLEDPGSLPDIDIAVARLNAAIEAGERIVIHGDYDADGICGTALLTRGLRRSGAVVEPFVPDRQRDGYGVAARLVEHAGQREVGVLITVDTGSSAHEELGRAQALGIDVIICDHHRFEGRPDGVLAFVNPMRSDSDYPHEDLCGSGIAYQLLRALVSARGGDPEHTTADEMALAAIATVGDQMPLRGENRILVRRGLERLGATKDPGLRALLEIARLGRRVDVQDVAFQLAPRINAPGRIARARTTLDVLLASDPATARAGAAQVDALNRERRRIGRECSDDAMEQARRALTDGDPAGLVLSSPAWHRGVVGIAAARVVNETGRPALLLAVEGDEAVGSARSVDGLDLVAALDGCSDLMLRYGGHAAAAGATVATERIDDLAARFAASVRAQAEPSTARAPLRIDAIATSDTLDTPLAAFLNEMGPFGEGNPVPRLAGHDWSHRRAPRVVGDGHLRLDLDHEGAARGLIAFGRAEAWLPVAMAESRLDVAFTVRYRPESKYDVWEMILDDLRPAARGLAEDESDDESLDAPGETA